MEANVCDINHLDDNARLPPRKRLLAGFQKQNSDFPCHQVSPPSTSDNFDTYRNNMLISHLKNPNLSSREIAESSRTAAKSAAIAAKAARSLAEEKAIIAAKAMAAAKCALELVACDPEEESSTELHSQNSKIFKKHQRLQNFDTDEELARELHRDMNRSGRISKNTSNPKHKKVRSHNGEMILEENLHTKCNGNSELDLKTSKFCKPMVNDEAGPSRLSSEKVPEAVDDTSTVRRKRGRIKLKKLPLSICTFKDQTSPKTTLNNSAETEDTRGKSRNVNISS